MTQTNFPPPGYVPGASSVPGIEIWVPAPQDTGAPDVVQFKCPKCGATTAYSVSTGRVACEHCGYSEATEEKRLGRSAEQFEFKVETVARSEKGWGVDRKDLSCKSCGGVVSIPPDALSYSCPFCGSNEVVYREALQDILRPRYLIPFKVNPEFCQSATAEWLGSSWMLPRNLRSAARMDRFTPIYIPYWTFDSTCKATWKAQVGKEVVEHYHENGEVKERRRVDWQWKSGSVERVFNDLLVPGSSRLNLSALGKIDSYNIHDLVLYEPSLLAGITAQSYDITLEQAWDAGRQVMREQTRATCMDRTGSSYVRDFSMVLNFEEEGWRYILVPVYTSIYAYGQKTYQILVNGQSGRIAGPRPVDWTRVWWVIAAILSPGVLLGLVGLVTLLVANVVIPAIALFLLVVGLVISFFIFRQAQEMENVSSHSTRAS